MDIFPIGCDDGHDSLKTCQGYNREKKQYHCSTIKSLALPGLHQLMSFNNESSSAYTADGKSFTIALDNALGHTLETRFIEYPVSPLNRVLVQEALCRAGLGGKKINLVTGLPVDQFYVDGRPNEKLINDKAANLLKEVTNHNANTQMASIAGSKVISEGIATFYDALLDGEGNVNAEVQQLISRRPIAVVDLGGKTCNQATISENASGVYKDRSGTENIGAIELKANISKAIKAQFNLNAEPPRKYVDEACLSKSFELFGTSKDISDILAKECREYVEKIRDYFQKMHGDGADLGAVIFSGGGTSLIRTVLGDAIFTEIYRGRIIFGDEYSNARGMWKAATYIIFKHAGAPNEQVASASNDQTDVSTGAIAQSSQKQNRASKRSSDEVSA